MRIPIAAMAGLLAAVGGTLAHAQGEPAPPTPPTGAAPVFFFETDEFWLNLHHFLYVLGRAETKARDSGREAVVHGAARCLEAVPGGKRQP